MSRCSSFVARPYTCIYIFEILGVLFFLERLWECRWRARAAPGALLPTET